MMMLSFNDFIRKYKLKNKATSNIKVQQILSSLFLSDVGIYLRDGPFKTDIGIVSLHPFQGTDWAAYINRNYFDLYGCPPPKKLLIYMKKSKHGKTIYSEYRVQKNDSLCASYVLYKIYLTKVMGLYFKSAVLYLNYRMIKLFGK